MRTAAVTTLTLRKPDDWHLHLRDAGALAAVVPHSAARFGRAIVMPNLRPPVTTVAAALAYRERILSAVPQGMAFTPLMTLYLTDATSPDEIARARASGVIAACKLYPAGATTNSDAGVTDIMRIQEVLERMSEAGMPLLIHGEVTDPQVDVFDREARFIERVMAPLVARLPGLRVVFEHVTTKVALEFLRGCGPNIAATLTPQHLALNRNALFAGGLRPHNYCLPVLKRESDRVALLDAAVSGDPRFFLGTDSAPHERWTKEHACGCAGVYSAYAALELYAEIFEQAGALARLEAFASLHGARFYRLPVNEERVTLVKDAWTVPDAYPFPAGNGATGTVVPWRAGERIAWRLASQDAA